MILEVYTLIIKHVSGFGFYVFLILWHHTTYIEALLLWPQLVVNKQFLDKNSLLAKDKVWLHISLEILVHWTCYLVVWHHFSIYKIWNRYIFFHTITLMQLVDPYTTKKDLSKCYYYISMISENYLTSIWLSRFMLLT